MSTESGATRWWENYLVRYFMPSIAGVAIVNWFFAYGDDGLRPLLALPISGERLDTASLTLLFLYGNLFCYVASYPILVFHATRVLDFADDKWRAQPLFDGYVTSSVLAVAAFLSTFLSEKHRYFAAFIMVSIFAAIQLARLCFVFFDRIAVEGCSGTVSPAFGYTYALARRRGLPVTETRTTSSDVDDDEDVSTTRRMMWRQEFMDTYRHLREHGNSAFIFLLELALAALVYCVITKPGHSAGQQLSAVGVLFAIWALPAVFIHLVGQHLERRFSHFDRRVAPITRTKQ